LSSYLVKKKGGGKGNTARAREGEGRKSFETTSFASAWKRGEKASRGCHHILVFLIPGIGEGKFRNLFKVWSEGGGRSISH